MKPGNHVWVKCPKGHGAVTHQHFDWCGVCQERVDGVQCGAVLEECEAPIPQWLPIESAPKDGFTFLGCTDNGVIQIIKRNKHLNIWVDEQGREAFRTMKHWMPLPPPPKESKE